MFSQELDIDKIVIYNLTGQQIKCAFAIALGTMTKSKIAKTLGVGLTTICNWEKIEYFQVLVAYVRLTEMYKNHQEYTELRKSAIQSANFLMRKGLDAKNPATIKRGLDALNSVLNYEK